MPWLHLIYRYDEFCGTTDKTWPTMLGQLAEQSTNEPKFEGSNLASAVTGERQKSSLTERQVGGM